MIQPTTKKKYSGENKLDETLTIGITATLLTLWASIFGFLIFYVVVPKHRKSFWSFQTGWQKSQAYFLANDGNDEVKLAIMECNRSHWRGIEQEVRAWTLANWGKWEAEQPDWFTAELQTAIPDDFIPAAAVVALGGAARLRRGSASLSVGEGMDVRSEFAPSREEAARVT